MKIFLSAIEGNFELVKKIGRMNYNLMSYYGIRKNRKIANYIRDNSKEVMIDSGAFSFQRGKKVDWIEYTKEYIDFIKEFDRPNVVGYFEMDIDNIIGYEKVLELRSMLEQVTDKIIPVWHKNRGIEEYKKMCRDYEGRVVAITGFKNEDIKDEQYMMFLKYAKKYNCRLHCLGMTRKKILDKVPFDYVDSSSWLQEGVYGRITNKGKVSREFSKTNRDIVFLENYKAGMKLQEYYYEKWKKVCKD